MNKLIAAPAKLRRRYNYKAIGADKARLLIVRPRSKSGDNDAIHATLAEVRFDDLGREYPFEALSYHWGDPSEKRKAIYLYDRRTPKKPSTKRPKSAHEEGYGFASVVDQVLRNQYFILPNLYQAIRHLQRRDEYVVLWIDAICIDQDNPQEKQEQVARIHQVYQKAKKVLIWLGTSGLSEAKAVNFAKEVVNLQSVETLIKDASRVDDWSCLFKLMSKSWFSRRWVIQELALARTAQVRCGEYSLEWDDLRDAISLFACYIEDIRLLFRQHAKDRNVHYALRDIGSLEAKVLVDRVNNFVRIGTGGTFEPMLGLEYLVSKLCCFQCSDPRDAIYALRNIAKETCGSRSWSPDRAPPLPEYTKSLLEVYTDFVKWVYKSTRTIDIICRKWALPEKLEEDANYTVLSILPSWIQPISDRYNDRSDGDSFVGHPGEGPYNASNSLAPSVVFSEEIIDFTNQPSSSTSSSQAPNASHAEVARAVFSLARKRRGSYDQQAVQQRRERAHQSLRGLGSEVPRLHSAKFSMVGGTRPPADSERNDFLVSNAKLGFDISIRVKGMQIGEVSWATEPITNGVIPPGVIGRLSRGTSHQHQVNDRLWRGLVAERGEDGRNPPTLYYRACRDIIWKYSPSGPLDTRNLLSQDISDISKQYLKRVQAVIWNRVFFEARGTEDPQDKSGTLHGFGPENARHGDIVCILYGCSVPCILRRGTVSQGQEYYKFIGESYIYGLMDGEAVSGLSQVELTKNTDEFRIL